MNRVQEDQGHGAIFLVRWLALVVFVGLLGLSYVHMKQKLASDGDLCRELENSLRELDEKLLGVNSDIRRFTGRPSLERRRQQGFIRVMDIADSRIVRLRPETQSAALPAADDRLEVNP